MRLEADVEDTIDRHGNAVWRVCFLYFGDTADAQDAFQETLFKYACNTTLFNEEEHRKAWLLRVATNVCKDMLKAAHRKNISFDEEGESATLIGALAEECHDDKVKEVLAVMSRLADPPRTPVYLALYEGYTAPEIATLLDANVNTVYSWIARGKEQLREALL